jgi:hypothetical protein
MVSPPLKVTPNLPYCESDKELSLKQSRAIDPSINSEVPSPCGFLYPQVFYRRIRVATLGNQRIKKSFFYSQKEAYQIRFSAANQ